MKILVTYAIPQERVDVFFDGCHVTYCQTGIGKVNAALSVYHAIQIHQPDLILNIGTAGSVVNDVDSIVICNTFVDRDMKKCKEFGVDYHLDFTEELSKITLFSGWQMHNTCN
ncbi:MAG: nucleosidase, partial [Bacteroidota bacterium]|nr:nucleosidase [Bacteroidota bacterium]